MDKYSVCEWIVVNNRTIAAVLLGVFFSLVVIPTGYNLLDLASCCLNRWRMNQLVAELVSKRLSNVGMKLVNLIEYAIENDYEGWTVKGTYFRGSDPIVEYKYYERPLFDSVVRQTVALYISTYKTTGFLICVDQGVNTLIDLLNPNDKDAIEHLCKKLDYKTRTVNHEKICDTIDKKLDSLKIKNKEQKNG